MTAVPFEKSNKFKGLPPNQGNQEFFRENQGILCSIRENQGEKRGFSNNQGNSEKF